MDAKKYIRDKYRMTDGCNIDCHTCNLHRESTGHDINCSDFESEFTDEAISIVEAWCRSFPERTILDDLKEKYPKYVPISKTDDTPQFCCRTLGYECNEPNCYEAACKKAWNSPL